MNDLSVLPWECEEHLREFARQYVKTGNSVSALQRSRVKNPEYRAIVWAERLLARSDVKRYVLEAQAESKTVVQKERSFTRESLAEDFQDIYEKAMELEELSPAVAAKSKQAELMGLMEKNVRISVTTSVKDMSMEDLERELARLKDDGVITLEQGDDGVFGVLDGD